MNIRIRPLAVALAAGIALTGCSGGEDASDETTAAPTAEPDQTDEPEEHIEEDSEDSDEPEEPEPQRPETDVDLDAYFAVVGGAARPDVDAGRAAAAPDSEARWYLDYLVAFVAAERASGFATEPAEVTGDEGTYEACAGGDCVTFGDLELDDDGRVVTLSVDGSPITGRIAEPGSTAELPRGGSVELTGAYFSEQFGGSLFTVRFENGDEPVDLLLYVSEYVGSDGVQVEATDAGGPDSLRANITAHGYFGFQDAPLGGTLYILAQDPQTYDQLEIELVIPQP